MGHFPGCGEELMSPFKLIRAFQCSGKPRLGKLSLQNNYYSNSQMTMHFFFYLSLLFLLVSKGKVHPYLSILLRFTFGILVNHELATLDPYRRIFRPQYHTFFLQKLNSTTAPFHIENDKSIENIVIKVFIQLNCRLYNRYV